MTPTRPHKKWVNLINRLCGKRLCTVRMACTLMLWHRPLATAHTHTPLWAVLTVRPALPLIRQETLPSLKIQSILIKINVGQYYRGRRQKLPVGVHMRWRQQRWVTPLRGTGLEARNCDCSQQFGADATALAGVGGPERLRGGRPRGPKAAGWNARVVRPVGAVVAQMQGPGSTRGSGRILLERSGGGALARVRRRDCGQRFGVGQNALANMGGVNGRRGGRPRGPKAAGWGARVVRPECIGAGGPRQVGDDAVRGGLLLQFSVMEPMDRT